MIAAVEKKAAAALVRQILTIHFVIVISHEFKT